MRPQIRPYPTAEQQTLVPDDWEIFVNGVASRGPFLDKYTPTCEIAAHRRLTLDVNALRSSSGIPDDGKLAVTASWYCPETANRGSVVNPVETAEASVPRESELRISGRDLAGKLLLRTQLVVLESYESSLTLLTVPTGAILWDDLTELRLSGSGSQFPVEIVDFAQVHLPQNAAWHLDWREGDWERPALGHIRLLLNRRVDRVARLASVEEPTPEDLLLMHAIQADLARTLVERALDDEDFLSRFDWDDGSTGQTVLTLIRALFGGVDRAHQLRSRSYAEFASVAQAALFGTPEN